MSGSPPLRFLLTVIGGWAALRTAFLAPAWWTPPAEAIEPAERPAPLRRVAAPKSGRPSVPFRLRPAATAARTVRAPLPAPVRPPPAAAQAPAAERVRLAAAPAAIAAMPGEAETVPAPSAEPARRWSLSAWSLLRRGGGGSLAAAGMIGGSQAGARALFRLNRDPGRPLALSLRATRALDGSAEAAAGLDWRPARRLPLHLLAERRQSLGRGGRSAFAVTVYGGIDDARLGALRIDGYAQAGLVGARSRDPFGDGAMRLSLPLGKRLGAGFGAWAAAQPGAARLDLGPQAALRLPVAGRTVAVAADWRLRLAGDARPGSGPTLTLASDF